MVPASLQLSHCTAIAQMIQRKLCFPAWQSRRSEAQQVQRQMSDAKQNQRLATKNCGHVA